MYRNVLMMMSLVVVLFAASCGGGGITIGEPNDGAAADTTAPEIAISGIDEGAYYGEQQPGSNFLLVKGVAADSSGVANMAIRINDTLVSSSNNSQVSFGWDVTGYADGTYVVLVQASDSAGNIGEATRSVHVDNDLIWIGPWIVQPIVPIVDPGLFDPFPLTGDGLQKTSSRGIHTTPGPWMKSASWGGWGGSGV